MIKLSEESVDQIPLRGWLTFLFEVSSPNYFGLDPIATESSSQGQGLLLLILHQKVFTGSYVPISNFQDYCSERLSLY